MTRSLNLKFEFDPKRFDNEIVNCKSSTELETTPKAERSYLKSYIGRIIHWILSPNERVTTVRSVFNNTLMQCDTKGSIRELSNLYANCRTFNKRVIEKHNSSWIVQILFWFNVPLIDETRLKTISECLTKDLKNIKDQLDPKIYNTKSAQEKTRLLLNGKQILTHTHNLQHTDIAPIRKELEEIVSKIDCTYAYHIRENTGARFSKFLERHTKLWNASPKYREIILAIETRTGQPMTFIDKETALAKLSELKVPEDAADHIGSFTHRACWHERLNAVIIFNPDTMNEGDILTLMAFESTNGYHQNRFDEINDKAWNGDYHDPDVADESACIEKAARLYAFANENIENDGRLIHQVIVDEVNQADSKILIDDWSNGNPQPKYQQLHEDVIKSEYGQDHIEYYKKHYRKHIYAHVLEKRKEDVRSRIQKQGVQVYQNKILPQRP